MRGLTGTAPDVLHVGPGKGAMERTCPHVLHSLNGGELCLRA